MIIGRAYRLINRNGQVGIAYKAPLFEDVGYITVRAKWGQTYLEVSRDTVFAGVADPVQLLEDIPPFEVYCLHRLPDASEAKLVAWLQELERKIDLERSYKGQDF